MMKYVLVLSPPPPLYLLSSMTPQEASFTNAFNANRPTLALFAKCSTKDELHVVRDAFFLGMASQLCTSEYEALRTSIIIDPR
jgi:hypothetical protein